MSTTIAFALLGLAVLAFLAVIGVILIASLVKAFRRPPPAARQATPLNPEDRNLDYLRRHFPAPEAVKQHVPDLEELHLDYDLKREREDRVARIRKGLDAGRTTAAPPPSPNA